MKQLKHAFILLALLIALQVFGQTDDDLKPPAAVQWQLKNRAAKPIAKAVKKDGIVTHKSFAFNRETSDFVMYVDFVAKSGRKYTIPAIFAAWTYSENEGGTLEIFTDDILGGYPSITFEIREIPTFWKQQRQ